MENASTPVSPPPTNPSRAVLARHVATATVNLLKALHFERFFGEPIEGFSADHNRLRIEVNDRTVRAYAREAGRYAFYAGETLDRWIDAYPQAMGVERIREEMGAGWHDAARVIGYVDLSTLVSA